MNKKITLMLLLLTVALVIYLCLPSKTARIKNLIQEGRNALLKKDLHKVMSLVSYHYHDRYGFTYPHVKKILTSLLEKNGHFVVELKNISLSVAESKTEVRLLLKLKTTTDKRETYLLGSEQLHETVVLILDRENLDWKVVEVYFPGQDGIGL